MNFQVGDYVVRIDGSTHPEYILQKNTPAKILKIEKKESETYLYLKGYYIPGDAKNYTLHAPFGTKETDEKIMTFIPGKYYTHGTIDKKKHRFIGVNSKGNNVWENANGSLWSQAIHLDWKEYKDPITHTRWVHWWKGMNGDIQATFFDVKKPLDYFGENKTVRIDEIVYVEEV